MGVGIMVALMLRRILRVLIPLVAAGFCAAADTKFADGLYPVLQKANCRTCHVDGGIASATRLHFPEGGASAGQIEAFGRSLTALVNRDQPEASPLFTKPTNRDERFCPAWHPSQAARVSSITRL